MKNFKPLFETAEDKLVNLNQLMYYKVFLSAVVDILKLSKTDLKLFGRGLFSANPQSRIIYCPSKAARGHVVISFFFTFFFGSKLVTDNRIYQPFSQ